MEPLVQLATCLAAHLAVCFPSVKIGETVYPLSPAWNPDPDEAIEGETLDTPQVWIVDIGESSKSEHGISEDAYELLVIIQHKLVPATAGQQVLALGRLASDIRRKIRPLEPTESVCLETPEVSAVCTSVVRRPARNLEEQRKHLFYTELLTTWKAC